MNKYQEAFNRLIGFVEGENSCAGIFFEYDGKIYDAMDVIQELVEKTTQMTENNVEIVAHGKWVDDHGNDMCSVCGFACSDTYYLGDANYCPECGAKMIGD